MSQNGPRRAITNTAAIAALWIATALGVQAATVPFDSPRWRIEATESRVEEHLGRPSLYLGNGMAWIEDVEFEDGFVEFDVAFTPDRGFTGALFRLQDPENYEHFYLRPHQSGQPDANQYTPVFNGVSGWQLYHGPGYGVPIVYPYNQWIHVRVAFSGSRGEAHIDSDEPLLFMHELKREPRPGKVGLSSFLAQAHFSNFSYQEVPGLSLTGTGGQAPAAPEGAVMNWSVSSAFAESRLEGKDALEAVDSDGLIWTSVNAESTGITNLARAAHIADETNTVFAGVSVPSETARSVPVRFGYSDRVRLYCNGRLVYRGDNGYRSRDFRYLGTIGLFDIVYLPLREGDNEIWFAVSESFGGWGILAAFSP
jgi:hypothetical protein